MKYITHGGNRLRKLFKRILNNFKPQHQDEDWIINARRNYSNKMLEKKSRNTKVLTWHQKYDILSFWKSFSKNTERLYNISQYTVYNKYINEGFEIIDYIPDDFYYCYADTYFTNYHTSIKIDDKNMYDLYFHDINMPKCVLRKINGALMTYNYDIIDLQDAVDLCMKYDRIVIKQSLNSDGGKGVKFIDDCFLQKENLITIIENNDNFIVQEFIEQHSVLAEFNPESINTIRIMTLFFDGKVIVLSSVLRMGVNGAKVDNASSGGIVCGINNDGSLKHVAFDANANIYNKHPQGKEFSGVSIPSFGSCVEIAKKMALRFINYTRLISWDFSVDTRGIPILVEANFTGGQLDFHQLCNGPIWGSKTREILTEVMNNSIDVKKCLN